MFFFWIIVVIDLRKMQYGGNKSGKLFFINVWVNNVNLVKIMGVLDEFKFGFLLKGLVIVFNKWWGIGG